MSTTPAEWPAWAGLASNMSISLEERHECAMKAIALLEQAVTKFEETPPAVIGLAEDAPPAWRDMITGLMILNNGRSNDISPTHCEHDVLTVCSDPDKFTEDELAVLEELGFVAGDDETFYSFRFGSA